MRTLLVRLRTLSIGSRGLNEVMVRDGILEVQAMVPGGENGLPDAFGGGNLEGTYLEMVDFGRTAPLLSCVLTELF
jgi:hypothetical protein